MIEKKNTLSSWDQVKDKRVDLKNINSINPENYYYQFDGYLYSPACYKDDYIKFKQVREKQQY